MQFIPSKREEEGGECSVTLDAWRRRKLSTEAATEAGEGLPLASPHPAQSWVLMSGGQSHSE